MTTTLEREVRVVGQILPPEARAQGQPQKIVGYAAMFDSPTNIGGPQGFMEKVARGAFTNTIAADDIRALFNHDQNHVLGRTKAGTLALLQDDKGLRFEITPPDTTTARDLMMSISRGDISQCSFAFNAVDQEWDDSGDMPLRTVRSAKLYDIGPVTFAAYNDTSVAVRSLEEYRSKSVVIPGRTQIIRSRLRMRSALSERELRRGSRDAMADMMPMTDFEVGDQVKVQPGKEHDKAHVGKTGIVKQIGTEALGIKFDGVPGIHKWYVDDELQSA